MKKPITEKQRLQRVAAGKAAQAKLTPEQRRALSKLATSTQWGDKAKPPANITTLIEEASENGATIANICAHLNVSRDTFYRWRDNYPEIDAALRRGKNVQNDRLINKLFDLAMKGNPACLIFACKVLAGLRENEPTIIQNTVAIQYRMPDALTPEAYLERLKSNSKLIPPAQVERVLEKPGVKAGVLREIRKELTHVDHNGE